MSRVLSHEAEAAAGDQGPTLARHHGATFPTQALMALGPGLLPSGHAVLSQRSHTDAGSDSAADGHGTCPGCWGRSQLARSLQMGLSTPSCSWGIWGLGVRSSP